MDTIDQDYEKGSEKREPFQNDRDAEREAYERRNAAEAEENRAARLEGQSDHPGNSEKTGGDSFGNANPETGLIPKDDSSVGEQIALGALERQFPQHDVVQLHESGHFAGTDYSGPRPDFLITNAQGDPVAVAEVKTHTGELSNEVLDKAYDQLLNGASQIDGIESAIFVSVNAEGMSELFDFSVDQLKSEDFGLRGFRDSIRGRMER